MIFETLQVCYHGAQMGYKVGQRLAIREENRDVVNWVSKHDYVWFDFSDWSPESLNSNTTSYVFGIPDGQLRVKADDNVFALNCAKTSTGSDVVFLYKWCREHAPGVSDRQRRFRFEHGKYAGEGEMKTKHKLGLAAIFAVGLLGALS